MGSREAKIWSYNGEPVKVCPGLGCSRTIFFVKPTPENGLTAPMPVVYSTGLSHFIDCPDASKFRDPNLKRKLAEVGRQQTKLDL